MTAYKILPFVTLESIVTSDGKLILDGLPFRTGDIVEVIIRGQPNLWCGELIESEVLCRSGDLICWGEWNFDLDNEARLDRTIVN